MSEYEIPANTCTHPQVMPQYRDADFENLSASEIKQKFPRFFGQCPDCGEQVILYSSTLHYIAGDW